eukprot:TRINITY_DN18663_c1_g1_i1.p1 TRINITY_DN18663_c1_g1~~TRINITY_DN18663_c1_g1_i1.p1  ORF type:complete len:618 (-),score=75.84 TRINITY_DN18663_c1_g1_i1:331-2076(-)
MQVVILEKLHSKLKQYLCEQQQGWIYGFSDTQQQVFCVEAVKCLPEIAVTQQLEYLAGLFAQPLTIVGCFAQNEQICQSLSNDLTQFAKNKQKQQLLTVFGESDNKIIFGSTSKDEIITKIKDIKIQELLGAPLRILFPFKLDVFYFEGKKHQINYFVEQAVQKIFDSLTSRRIKWMVKDTKSGNSKLISSNKINLDIQHSEEIQYELSPIEQKSGENYSITYQYQKCKHENLQLIQIPVAMDIIFYSTSMNNFQDIIQSVLPEAIQSQLLSIQSIVCREGLELKYAIKMYHFLPPGFDNFVTIGYSCPNTTSKKMFEVEDNQRNFRLNLHKMLGLQEDRPLLRVGNAMLGYNVSGQQNLVSRLVDVHKGLPPSGIPNGQLFLIDGSYEYFHYMQDKFDDNGWGCAYRSLQTIYSWFRLQHYTFKPIPNHTQIQQKLIDLGDTKEKKFVGSKEWIGAIELGYVLDYDLDIMHKILMVERGEEMPGAARGIAQHFQTQGTPIMIGGGVLAYTLIGIDWNEATGEVAFLILDPHYTGVDDLKKIHSGQWIGWKRLGDKAAAGGDLFVKDAFYRLLCPQRPKQV